MSPILKRDVAETVRQARRLAAAAGLRDYDEYAEFELDPVGVSRARERAGAEVDELDSAHARAQIERKRSGSGSLSTLSDDAVTLDTLDSGSTAPTARVSHDHAARAHPYARASVDRRSADLADDRRGLLDATSDSDESAVTTMSMVEGKFHDLRGLIFSATPSLLFALLGLVFSGQLLEHCARWRVFRRVDELFILFPMIGNLKGNLEMCLSARLGTSATLGELDSRRVRHTLLKANLTLLGLQTLLISSLAAVLSFVLGLVTIHRLGDVPADGVNPTVPDPGTVADPSVNDPWREGTTRPGPAQLVMVLATSMGASGLTALTLGTFMCSLVVVCRWRNIDPDNITPPVAACLGDLVTLFILALIGSALVGAMDTPVPLIAVILMTAACVWFTRRVMRDEWVRNIARGSWAPLILAMLISAGTGMTLESGVSKYKGFALLAVSMTGLTGSIGAIHANRLSTLLHQRLHPDNHSRVRGLSPAQSMAVLFALSFPCQGVFLLFVNLTGWIDVDLGWAGWLAYAVTTAFSLLAAHALTLFCWHRDLDPDSYVLPILTAIVDFVGQFLLIIGYELCRLAGGDVVAEAIPPA